MPVEAAPQEPVFEKLLVFACIFKKYFQLCDDDFFLLLMKTIFAVFQQKYFSSAVEFIILIFNLIQKNKIGATTFKGFIQSLQWSTA